MKNLELTYLADQMSDSAKNAVSMIVKTLKENGISIVNLQSEITDADTFYSYELNTDTMTMEEEKIVAIRVVGDTMEYIADNVHWSNDNLKKEKYAWYPLFGGENYGIFTAYWLAERFGEIDLEDENIVIKKS